jgi:hypothetical protein
LLDGEAEALTRKAIELALGGDLNALRLCLDRIVPPRREQPIEVDLPKLGNIFGVPHFVAKVIAAVTQGEITLYEAAELGKLVDMYVRGFNASERAGLEARKALWDEEDRAYDTEQRRRLGLYVLP